MSNNVNIDSVAKASGFSKATVSRVMRNDSRVAPKTRETILKWVESMGYRPNPLVAAHMRNVRLNKKSEVEQTIGLITFLPQNVKWQSCPSQRRLLQGVYDRALEIGFRVDEFAFTRSNMSCQRLSNILHARGIQGIIIGPMHHGFVSLEMNWNSFSMVTMGGTVQNPNLHRIRSDNFHNLFLAMESLTRYGYRRIGLVIDKMMGLYAQGLWLGGFLTYMMGKFAASEISPLFMDPQEDCKSTELVKSVRDYVRNNRLDAVIGYDHLLDNLLEGGIRVPEDCAFANLHIDDHAPPTAGIDERGHEIGVRTLDLLAEMLYQNERGVPAQPETILIDGGWVAGWTAPPLKSISGSLISG